MQYERLKSAMKKQDLQIVKQAAATLESTTGIKAALENSRNKSVDFAVSLYPQKADSSGNIHTINYFVEVKNQPTRAWLNQFISTSKNRSHSLLLVADYINPAQSEYLRENNIPFFDSVGNAYINDSGLYVFISGKKGENLVKERPSRLFNKSGLKILFALLVDEKLIDGDFRTISKVSGVSSTSTVSDIFNDLEKSGFLIRRGKPANEKRSLLNRETLIKRWAIAYGERLRPTLEPVRFSSKKYPNTRWWQAVELSEYEPGACWGGEEGGAILSNHLKPETVTIYADSRLPKLQAKYGLQRDPRGNVEILKKFWIPDLESKSETKATAAPPLVVYADLLTFFDERCRETAKIIYEKHLAPAAK